MRWLKTLCFSVLASALFGCAQFQDTIGCYTHTDATLGYVHQFGDSSSSGINGTLAPEHGRFGESTFSIDRPDEFSENILKTELTFRFGPGACQ